MSVVGIDARNCFEVSGRFVDESTIIQQYPQTEVGVRVIRFLVDDFLKELDGSGPILLIIDV